jgi:hypothetical protein
MEIKSQYYSEYINTKAGEIPSGALIEIIDEFASNAKFYMSSDADSITTAKINSASIDLLKNRFRFLPLSLIAEAYTRGSLGELGGTTRFTVRNVYTWLGSIDEKNQRLYQETQSKIDDQKRAENERLFRRSQKRSSLFASALYWKISHCPMSDPDYDRLTLDKIVEAIEKGYTFHELTPSMIL